MSNPFDPLGWFLKGSREQLGRASSTAAPWIDRWVEATTWWADVDNWIDLANDPARPVQLVLVDLAEGMTRRFAGKQVEVDVAGEPCRLTIDSIRVEPATAVPARESGTESGSAKAQTDPLVLRARAEVRGVEYAGRRIGQVSVFARKVRLVPAVPFSELVASDIDVTLRTPARELVSWIEPGAAGGWTIEVVGERRVTLSHPHRDLTIVAEPVVLPDRVRLDLREVRYRGRRIKAPSWFAPSRTVDIPVPDGVQLLAGWWHGDTASLHLHVQERRWTIDLGTARTAVRRGTPEFEVNQPR